jgi:hypothetical protein
VKKPCESWFGGGPGGPAGGRTGGWGVADDLEEEEDDDDDVVNGVVASFSGTGAGIRLVVEGTSGSTEEASSRLMNIRPWLSYASSALRSRSRTALGRKGLGKIMADQDGGQELAERTRGGSWWFKSRCTERQKASVSNTHN